MTVRTPDSGFESIEHRYERLERFLPLLLLAVPLVPYVLSQSPTAGAFGITAGVAVAAGAWITWMIHLHPRWTEHRWLMRVYFTGLLAFIAMLTIRSPWFAFFTWLGFLHAFRFLPGAWRWVGCAAVGDLLWHGPVGGIPPADRIDGGHLGAPGVRRRRARGSLHPAGREVRGAESGPQGHDRRARRRPTSGWKR